MTQGSPGCQSSRQRSQNAKKHLLHCPNSWSSSTMDSHRGQREESFMLSRAGARGRQEVGGLYVWQTHGSTQQVHSKHTASTQHIAHCTAHSTHSTAPLQDQHHHRSSQSRTTIITGHHSMSTSLQRDGFPPLEMICIHNPADI